MATEQTSIEELLDEAPSQSQELAPEPVTGADSSAATPADANAQHEPRSDDGPMVPRRALEDERRKRQDYERQIAEYQARMRPEPQQSAQPVEPPDMFTDPQGYTRFVVQQASVVAYQAALQDAQRLMLSKELDRSERRARKTHGDEVIDQALQAAESAGIKARFAEEDDAYDALVKWYQGYQIALDPDAARARIEAEILAKHGIAQQPNVQAAPAKPRAPVPRSLASTASAQPRDDRGRFSGPTPIEDIIP